MSQRFIAREPFEFANGATGYRPGGPFDCLGPYAKVINCPVKVSGEELHLITHPDNTHEFIDTRVYLAKRYTCYASGYADTFFSIPANTRINGKHIRGFFTQDGNGGVEFVAYQEQIKL